MDKFKKKVLFSIFFLNQKVATKEKKFLEIAITGH